MAREREARGREARGTEAGAGRTPPACMHRAAGRGGADPDVGVGDAEDGVEGPAEGGVEAGQEPSGRAAKQRYLARHVALGVDGRRPAGGQEDAGHVDAPGCPQARRSPGRAFARAVVRAVHRGQCDCRFAVVVVASTRAPFWRRGGTDKASFPWDALHGKSELQGQGETGLKASGRGCCILFVRTAYRSAQNYDVGVCILYGEIHAGRVNIQVFRSLLFFRRYLLE